MVFSDEYKYLGICIPKNGSTSIQSLFSRYGRLVGDGPGEHHMDLQEALRLFPHTKDYFKFAFVRNPYDRILSFYHHFAHVRHDLLVPDAYLPSPRYADYTDFLARIWNDKYWVCDLHFKPQHTFIDLSQMDFVGRFETFENDMRKLTGLLNLPPYETTPHDRKSHYEGACDCPYPSRGFFDISTSRMAYEHFKRDFELFEYDKSDWETDFHSAQMKSFLSSLPKLGV